MENILQLNPNHIANLLGLRQVLSVGRNDGLASMLRIIQGQLQDLLEDNAKYKLVPQKEEDEDVTRRLNRIIILSNIIIRYIMHHS